MKTNLLVEKNYHFYIFIFEYKLRIIFKINWELNKIITKQPFCIVYNQLLLKVNGILNLTTQKKCFLEDKHVDKINMLFVHDQGLKWILVNKNFIK